jgi:hypothetical protein
VELADNLGARGVEVGAPPPVDEPCHQRDSRYRTATPAATTSRIQAALTRVVHAVGTRLPMTAKLPAAAAAMTSRTFRRRPSG